MPKVTALVPCFNASEFIEATLDSLARQTWPNLEILIGDDSSTDDTPAIVLRFAEGRDDVRVIRRESNLGWLRNSNDLMAKASGELMFFAFHDDLIAPDYVEKLATALVTHPQAVMAFSDVDVVELDGAPRTWSFTGLDGMHSALRRGLVMCTLARGWWVPNRGVFRSWAFRRIGGIKPNAMGEYSADWTWLLHMSLLGEFVRVPRTLCTKFYRKGSLSKTWPHDRERRRALIEAGIREVQTSGVGFVARTLIAAYLRNQLRQRRVPLPEGLKNWVKSIMGVRG